MAFTRLCDIKDVPDDDMVSFVIDFEEVLVVRDAGGALHAFEATCPHEDFPLVEGLFDGSTITCVNHGWIFDASNGRGINPLSCRIAQYPIRVDGDEVLVDLEGEVPPA